MIRVVTALGLIAACAGVLVTMVGSPVQADDSADRVFEIRTYHTLPGRLPALNQRFQEHTIGLFKKHGMESIGYWMPTDEKDGKDKTLVYILAFPSREAAAKAWAEFRADPVWQKAQAESEADGKIVEKVESVFLTPTQYSMIK